MVVERTSESIDYFEQTVTVLKPPQQSGIEPEEKWVRPLTALSDEYCRTTCKTPCIGTPLSFPVAH